MKGVGDKLRGRRKATRALTLKTNNKFLPKSKRSQVWVETVIYTLIALTVIGLFISFAKPKIEEIQDKAIVEQSVAMLEDIGGISHFIKNSKKILLKQELNFCVKQRKQDLIFRNKL